MASDYIQCVEETDNNYRGGVCDYLELTNPEKEGNCSIDTPQSEIKRFEVNSKLCCCFEQFRFINDLGVCEIMLTFCCNESTVKIESKEYQSCESCDHETSVNGTIVFQSKGTETFKVVTPFLKDKETGSWIHEFIRSPLKQHKKNGVWQSVALTGNSYKVFQRIGFVALEFEFRYVKNLMSIRL